MKVVTEILQDLEILKRLLKHNANLKIRINYYLTISQKSCMFLLSAEIFEACLTNSVDPDQTAPVVAV